MTKVKNIKQKKFSFGNNSSGFTLIEIITAIAVFIVIMTISMGSIIGVFEADRKSKSLRSIMGNLNLSVETMAREMRFGQNYHCGSSGTITIPQNCPSGGTFVSFLSSENEQIVYRKNGTALEKSINGGASYVAVTAPEVTVDDAVFYVLGAVPGDNFQPKVLVKVNGKAGTGKSETEFTLQTLVSQRSLDN